MPHLIESKEWRLIHTLGRLLDQRKALYSVETGAVNNREAMQPNAELIEVELRRVFMVKEISRKLDQAEFEQCQAKLKSLCSLLNSLARSPNAHGIPEGSDYPRLQGLKSFLESTTGLVDLAIGPNETLFRLPRDAGELCDCLQVVTECNDVLSQLPAPPPQEPIIQPRRKWKKGTKQWRKATIRNRAMFLLGTLFQHFKCGTPHEVLLKLIEDPDENSVLQLMLSLCPELEVWQEAQCDAANLGNTSSLSIPDICADLRQHTGQGKALMLFIAESRLFGAWSGPTSSATDSSSKESLDQLISKGVFMPLNLTMLHQESPARISIKDKRSLAVKLGFCLMDFFDTAFTSKKIYFLNSSKPDPRKEFPYLAFSSKLPVKIDSYTFQIGHPTLLSFAKLLLEIDLGENIDLDISPNNSENETTWTRLMVFVERLERERSDSYLEAIRGCLVVHHEIAKALNSRDRERKSVDSIIRKKLYKEIVHKLELGLDESIPRFAPKRQRSESPPPSDCWGGAQAGSSTEMTIRPGKRERAATSRLKKRHTSEPQARTLVDSDLHDDNALTDYPADSLPSNGSGVITSMRPSRRDDFEIAIICALPLEFDAVCYIFDKFWDENGDEYGRAKGDFNYYTTGRVGKYNTVLALLPDMGKANAASAVASMRSSYGGLRLALLVGVCGGVPQSRHSKIFLGDVVISNVVFQYDFGRHYPDGFECKKTAEGNLGPLNKDICNLVTTFETKRVVDKLNQRTADFLRQLQVKAAQEGCQSKYAYPGTSKDKLFEPTHRHKHHVSPTCICRDCFNDSDPVCEMALSSSCADLGCDYESLIERKRPREKQPLEHDRSDTTPPPQPAIHVGAVASGDKVMKSAVDRDRIAKQANVIAFEMEGAGVWDEVPCIVVKGVCDYADSHKHKGWQNFAAATAASASKAILERYIQTDRS